MTVRGSRYGKKGVASTFGGVDFGQDADYMVFGGVTKLTDVSAGVKNVTVDGITTLISFTGSIQYSAASPIVVVVKSLSTNIASCAFLSVVGANDGGTSLAANTSGVTLHWLAVGTQA